MLEEKQCPGAPSQFPPDQLNRPHSPHLTPARHPDPANIYWAPSVCVPCRERENSKTKREGRAPVQRNVLTKEKKWGHRNGRKPEPRASNPRGGTRGMRHAGDPRAAPLPISRRAELGKGRAHLACSDCLAGASAWLRSASRCSLLQLCCSKFA